MLRTTLESDRQRLVRFLHEKTKLFFNEVETRKNPTNSYERFLLSEAERKRQAWGQVAEIVLVEDYLEPEKFNAIMKIMTNAIFDVNFLRETLQDFLPFLLLETERFLWHSQKLRKEEVVALEDEVIDSVEALKEAILCVMDRHREAKIPVEYRKAFLQTLDKDYTRNGPNSIRQSAYGNCLRKAYAYGQEPPAEFKIKMFSDLYAIEIDFKLDITCLYNFLNFIRLLTYAACDTRHYPLLTPIFKNAVQKCNFHNDGYDYGYVTILQYAVLAGFEPGVRILIEENYYQVDYLPERYELKPYTALHCCIREVAENLDPHETISKYDHFKPLRMHLRMQVMRTLIELDADVSKPYQLQRSIVKKAALQGLLEVAATDESTATGRAPSGAVSIADETPVLYLLHTKSAFNIRYAVLDNLAPLPSCPAFQTQVANFHRGWRPEMHKVLPPSLRAMIVMVLAIHTLPPRSKSTMHLWQRLPLELLCYMMEFIVAAPWQKVPSSVRALFFSAQRPALPSSTARDGMHEEVMQRATDAERSLWKVHEKCSVM